MTEITLTQGSVNGGTAVTIPGGATVTYGWTNLINATPITQNFSTIVQADVNGWENPAIVISGFFDVDNFDANEIRHDHLINFARIKYDGTNAINLVVPTGNGTSQTNLLANDALTTTLSVIVESFDVTISTDSEQGHIWTFTLVLRETA